MSSLAKQLKQLQIPSNLVAPSTKKQSFKASLLFDGKEAADIDNETIFSLATNGLEELRVIEPAFDSFKESLFGDLSKKMERSLQTQEFNDRLDKQIAQFLRYLSPYLLLKPAHKTLEWMVRRFRIHVLNQDDLMYCILPYHETNLFARVVQLLKIRNPGSKWHWLEPLQKTGSPLSKTTLIQKCVSDFAFLHEMCEMVPNALETDCPASSLRVVFTFYASTVVGALEAMDPVSEEVIGKLLPFVLKGLKSGITEYKCASYMVIAQLCNKCSLEEKLVKSLLDSVCKHLTADVIKEGLMCITIICNTQKKGRLSKKAFRYLMHVDGIANQICQLKAICDITALLQVLLPQLVSAVVKECLPSDEPDRETHLVECLYSLAKELDMEKWMIELIARTLIDEYCKARSSMEDDASHVKKLNKILKPLAQYLEKRYPKELEVALEVSLEGLKSTSDDEETILQYSQWTLEFVSLALSGFKSKVVPESSATLMLSLHHPKSDVRQLAVKYLHDLLKDEQVSQDDNEFISGALLARLSDDDLMVVDGVLDMKQILIQYLPSETLIEKLLFLLDLTNWNTQCDKAVSLLTSDELADQNEALLDRVVCGLISLLLLNGQTHKQAVQLSRNIAQSGLTEKHFLLQGMKTFVKKKEWKSCETTSNADDLALGNQVLFNWLANNLTSIPETQLMDKIQQLCKYSANHAKDNFTLILNCVLGKVVAKATVAKQLDVVEVVLEVILVSLQDVEQQDGSHSMSVEDNDPADKDSDGTVPIPLISKFVNHVSKNRIRRTSFAKGEIHLWLLGNIIRSLPGNNNIAKGSWWDIKEEHCLESKYTKILLSIYEVLVHGISKHKSTIHCATFRQLMQELIQNHLSSNVSLLKFLSLIWSCQTSEHIKVSSSLSCPILLQHHSLQIGNTCLSLLDKHDLKKIYGDASSVVTSLLVPLCSPVSSIRKDALTCFKTLHTDATTVPPPVGTLVGLVVESSEEIEADHEHLQRILTSAFSCLTSSQVKSTPRSKSKKSSEEKLLEGLLDYLVTQTVSHETPIYVQKCLLMMLSGVVTQSVLALSLPWMDSLVTKATTSGLSADENTCLNLLIKKFSPITASMLESEPKTHEILKTIFGLKSPVCTGQHPPVVCLLVQITEEFFQAIPSTTVQQEIVSMLIDMLMSTKNAVLVNKAKSTLIQVTMTAEHVIEELCKLKTDHDAKTPKKKKARRTENIISEETSSWQRVTIIIELLQQKENVVNEQQLIPTLFAILSRSVEVDDTEQVNFDYIKQLVLSEILNICQRVGKDGSLVGKGTLPEDKFNVELIVQCIRVSENPQTHHHALLLLAAAAKLFPEKVLHNVMSIFTFMGANVLRQDDSYSFQVISKTVETVIPALIQAGEKQQLPKLNVRGSPTLSLDNIVAMVIRVFVDASPHIPEHRRLPVFSHLVSTVGSLKFLHVTLILLMERYVVHSTDPADTEEDTVPSPLDLDFCVSLCQEFDSSVQAEALLNLLKYITQLPAEKPDASQRPRASRRSTALFNTSSPLFDVQTHSSKHLRHFKFVAIGFISTLLSSESFVTQLEDQTYRSKYEMEKVYLSLIEELLTFVTTTAQYAEGHAQGTVGKFWRALLHRIYDIIDKVNELLPPNVFINVMRRLLHNSNSTVRRKSMDLLNTKLGNSKAVAEQVDELVQLVDDLLSLVSKSDGSETPVNRQTALYSLKLLSRILSEQQPKTFTKVLEACITVFTNKNENSQVSSNAILCLGEVSTGLKASIISYLPQFMPNLLSLLERTECDRNMIVVLCTVVTLHKVTETLPNFLSPYLVQILSRVTCPVLNGQQDSAEEQQKDSTVVQVHDRLAVLRKDLARVITPRVLIPVLSQCYDEVMDNNHMAIPLLMHIVQECITCMTKRDVTTYSEQIFKFLSAALDFRVTQPQCEPDLLDKIELDVLNSFGELVMKMSEATFRPVFLKLLERATRNNADRDRLLVFYRLCDSLAGKLKGLMVLFAGYIIKNSATLLDSNNMATAKEPFYVTTDSNGKETADHRKSCLLVQYIVDCLQKCMCHATQGFMDKERFTCLMQPIVDQLENQMGSEQEFRDRISNHVVPCLAQLAVAAGNDTDWKPLNYQVLLKTRHSSSKVRFAALKALEEFYRQLGEEFVVVLLPESIPFLAELMEDECVEVEQECQHVVQQIEVIIGEPIQKYFES